MKYQWEYEAQVQDSVLFGLIIFCTASVSWWTLCCKKNHLLSYFGKKNSLFFFLCCGKVA